MNLSKVLQDIKNAAKALMVLSEAIPENERAISFEIIREQVWNLTSGLGWLIDVYEDEGQMYALLSSNGKLLRQQLGIVNDEVVLAGEPFLVSVDHPQTRTTIQRQASGRYRWFSISATSVLNRVGEIDSKALFDSFEAHCLETGEYPIRQFYHLGSGFRTGQCDFVARTGNCLVTSGVFDDTLIAMVEIEARENKPGLYGESIGFIPKSKEVLEIEKGINIPVYTSGILRDITNLPEKEAAALFTITEQQEVIRMQDRQKKAWIDIFINSGRTEEEALKWLDDFPGDLNRSIEDNKLITRNKEGKNESEKELIKPDSINRETIEFFDSLQKQMTEVIAALDNLNVNQAGILERLDTNEERFDNLERSRVEDLQQTIENMPSVPQVPRFEYKPRQSKQSLTNGMATMADQASSLRSSY